MTFINETVSDCLLALAVFFFLAVGICAMFAIALLFITGIAGVFVG